MRFDKTLAEVIDRLSPPMDKEYFRCRRVAAAKIATEAGYSLAKLEKAFKAYQKAKQAFAELKNELPEDLYFNENKGETVLHPDCSHPYADEINMDGWHVMKRLAKMPRAEGLKYLKETLGIDWS